MTEIYKLNDSLTNVPKIKSNLNLVLGYFDAFHIGHQKLVFEAYKNASNKLGIITFDVNYKNDELITDLEDRIVLFKQSKIDYIFVLPFNENIKNLTAEEFINLFLKKLPIDCLYVGENFLFGKNRSGDSKLLKKYFKTKVIKLVKDHENKISTKYIINLLKKGKIKEVNKLLNRNYQVKGKIVEGLKNGRTINFPTANIKLVSNYAIPKNGVYKTLIYINGIPHLSITNVGVHPTVDKLKSPILETHILNYSKDIYNKNIYLEFVDYIRPEKKFNSLELLKKQIKIDIAKIKQ